MIGMHFTNAADFDNIPPEVTHIRLWDVGVHWGAIHTAPDVYDWSKLDALVDKAKGKHLTYVIAGCPRWLAKYPNQGHAAPWLGPGSNSMPHDMDEANKFAWNLATRYKGRIKAYEVWNEPQLADFMYPYNDAECSALATMTKRFYKTIKSCDPGAMVLAASVLPRTSSGGMIRAGRYLSAMKKAGWNVDAFTCHIYPEVGLGAIRWGELFNNVVRTLKALEAPTTRLWVTETAFGLLGPSITNKTTTNNLIGGMYVICGNRFVFHYAWNRPDLGGILLAPNTNGWSAIVRNNP